jgi:hypothetical protein
VRVAAVALAGVALAVPASAASRIVVTVHGSSTSLVPTSCFAKLRWQVGSSAAPASTCTRPGR